MYARIKYYLIDIIDIVDIIIIIIIIIHPCN